MGRYPKKLEFIDLGNQIDIDGVSITHGLSELWENFNGTLSDKAKNLNDLIINFKLYSYNTGSSAYIVRTMFILIENCLNKNFHINWFYDPNDEDMEDAGLMYLSIVKQELKKYTDFRNLTFKLQLYE